MDGGVHTRGQSGGLVGKHGAKVMDVPVHGMVVTRQSEAAPGPSEGR